MLCPATGRGVCPGRSFQECTAASAGHCDVHISRWNKGQGLIMRLKTKPIRDKDLAKQDVSLSMATKHPRPAGTCGNVRSKGDQDQGGGWGLCGLSHTRLHTGPDINHLYMKLKQFSQRIPKILKSTMRLDKFSKFLGTDLEYRNQRCFSVITNKNRSWNRNISAMASKLWSI